MNTPADSNTRENANTNTDISITANATGFSTKTLNPQILVTLWNVERLGSFSAVARETGWSQPAISQQIRKIERELDAKLVQRTSHGVELTPIGRILARHGQLIDNRVTQAVKDVEDTTPIYIYSTINLYCASLDIDKIVEKYREELKEEDLEAGEEDHYEDADQ